MSSRLTSGCIARHYLNNPSKNLFGLVHSYNSSTEKAKQRQKGQSSRLALGYDRDPGHPELPETLLNRTLALLSLAFNHPFYIGNHSQIHPQRIPEDNEAANEHENARFKEMLRTRTRRNYCKHFYVQLSLVKFIQWTALNLGRGPARSRKSWQPLE